MREESGWTGLHQAGQCARKPSSFGTIKGSKRIESLFSDIVTFWDAFLRRRGSADRRTRHTGETRSVDDRCSYGDPERAVACSARMQRSAESAED
jgi:hypothetical protein